MSPLLLVLACAVPRPILITVDDLPIAASRLHRDPAERRVITERMLATLAKHHITAVGLATLARMDVEGDRALLERWIRAGHELGNHSDQHLSYTATSSAAYIADVERARVALSALLAPHQRPLRFFRYPFLREGDTPAKLDAMRDYLARSRQRALPVTIDDQDWSLEEPYVQARMARDQARQAEVLEAFHAMLTRAIVHHEEVGDDLMKRAAPQILLLHATEVGSAAWDRLFTWLERRGHRFATVDEVLADPAFAAVPPYVGTHGFGLWDRHRAERRRAAAQEAIAALLREQAAAWTRGDLQAFCGVYAADASFISPTGKVVGRDRIYQRYLAKYGRARETMGALELTVDELRLAHGFEVTADGDAVPSRVHGASVIMRWRLTFPARAAAEGLSLITLQPGSDGRWLITQDASM